MQWWHGTVLLGKILLHLEYVRKRSLLQVLFGLQRQIEEMSVSVSSDFMLHAT